MDLKIKDVAELLSVSETTIRRWLSDGKIPAYRLNHQYRFSRIEIENWMMSQKVSGDSGRSPFEEKQIYPPVSQKKKELSTGKTGTQQFSLYRAIYKGAVLQNMKGGSKEEIIRKTIKEVSPMFGFDPEVVAELFLDREKLMSTALSHGVAVPHTRDFILQDPTDRVVIVFPEKPVEFGALDGVPVHSLFFLFTSNDKRHLHILAKIAHLSSHKEVVAFLQTKPGKDDLLEFVKTWEGKVQSPME